MELHLKISGILLMLLSFIHIGFPRYFSWASELEPLRLINRQMMQVHTFFVALVVFLIGLLSFCCSTDLIKTKLGKEISLGLALFWGIRLVFQFFVYSPKLWKGKVFESYMHILFSILWMYLTLVFSSIYFQ